MRSPAFFQPHFRGDAGTLFGLHVKHFLLTVVTLGIYAFWGRSNVRQYLYAQTELAKDRFTYDGTGSELFRGWLKAVGILMVGFLAAGVVSAVVHQAIGALLLYAGGALLFFPLAVLGSRHYRLSRTTWRGIRFSFRASLGEFLRIFVPGMLLNVITLGFYAPIFHANVRRYLVDHSYFGHAPFSFDGNGRDLFARYLLAVLLTPFTLGLYWCWYIAVRDRYYWEHTRFGAMRFRSTVTGGELLSLMATNLLILLVTLGLGFAWVQARTIRFRCEHLALIGDAATLDGIVQDAQTAGTTGEGLAEMFDLDLVGADLFGL